MTARSAGPVRRKPRYDFSRSGGAKNPPRTIERGKPSIAVVTPSPSAAKALKGYSGFDRAPSSKGLGAPGTGKVLPSQTGKPWPGGGTVPPPDTGNSDARRVDMRGGSVPAGAKPYSVTPGSNTPHIHV